LLLDPVRLHDPHADQRLVHVVQQVRHRLAVPELQPERARPVPVARHREHGQDREHGEGQLPRLSEHHGDREGDEEPAAHEERQAALQELLEALDVGRQAGDDAARRLPREVVEVERVQVREQAPAEIGQVALREPSHRALLEVGAAHLREHEDRHHDGADRDDLRVASGHAVVDRIGDDQWRRHLGDDRDRDPGEPFVAVAPERPELAEHDAQRGSGVVGHRLPDRIQRERAPVLGELEQFVVGPVGDDAAAVEQHDAVREADRLDPVRDHERRAAPHRLDEAAPDGGLGWRIDRAHRVVEDQHP
jgi:hypothetical protein